MHRADSSRKDTLRKLQVLLETAQIGIDDPLFDVVRQICGEQIRTMPIFDRLPQKRLTSA